MKRITAKDVAHLAGVSQSTVSFVLNNVEKIGISEATRLNVLSAAKQLGYGPFASYQSEVSNNIIAIFVPNLLNPFYSMLVSEIQENVYQRGYCILVCETNRDSAKEREQLHLCEKSAVSGIIFGYSPDITHEIALMLHKRPAVVIGEMQDVQDLDVVVLNSAKAGYLVANHLLELGHLNFGFLSLDLKHPNRLEGIRMALRDSGKKTNLISLSAHEFEIPDSDYSAVHNVKSGYTITNYLLDQHPETTAIIAVNDLVASGVYHALLERQLQIPKDISVCGFDNCYISTSLYPTLTTIDHCLSMRCKLAIDILFERMNPTKKKEITDKYKYNVVYDPILIERNSTGPVK